MSKYEDDFYLWTQSQAHLLRSGAWSAVDLEHLAEEIEDVGKNYRHAVQSHLKILLQHLLKCRYQPPARRRWLTSIDNARTEIELKLRDSPSLEYNVPDMVDWAYRKARRAAARETGLPLATFPQACEWTPAQLLDEDFLP
jgi:hypothetical protein